MKVHLQIYHCLTALHHGAGEGIGTIDRPLLRDTWTEEPYLLSGSLRGKGRLYQAGQSGLGAAFGPPVQPGGTAWKDGKHGALGWSDARLLFLPVQSRFGTTAYLTSPLALARLGKYAQWAGHSTLPQTIKSLLDRTFPQTGKVWGCFGPLQEGETGVWMDHVLRFPGHNMYILDRLGVLERTPNEGVGRLLWNLANTLGKVLFPTPSDRTFWCSRVLLVSDDLFKEAVKKVSAVEPATAIDNASGTAKDGSLRFTEYLPEGTILAGLLWNESDNQEIETIQGNLSHRTFALGANTTGGKGLVACRELKGGTP